MIYVRPPTAEEQRELKRMTRQEIGRVGQRAQMILLSAQQRTVPEIALIFELSPVTVRFWLRKFDREGPAGLYDEARSGRPRTVDSQGEETLVDLIQNDPHQAGYVATYWTVAMLAWTLLQTLGLTLSSSALRRALPRLGLRWGQPRVTMPAKLDPDKAGKQWWMTQAVIDAGPQATVLYGDESRLQLLPLIRAMWHWVGQQLRIPTPGTNVTRALFGALNIRTGQWAYLVRERLRKEDFLAFLEYLLEVYPTGAILFIVDNYSSHTAHLVRAWLTTQPRLRLFYLPTYCSHLNPVEPIWLRLKNKIAANRLYGSMPMLLEAVALFFTDMTPAQALTWAAVLNV